MLGKINWKKEVIFVISTSCIPKTNFTTLTDYANDTTILISNRNPMLCVAHAMQCHINQISNWFIDGK